MGEISEENPESPIAPSPEPLSPVLETRKFESSTYRLECAYSSHSVHFI